MIRQSAKEGELFVDHRASPGLPPGVAQHMGFEPAQMAEGTLFEAATLMCEHCRQIAIKNPLRTRERAFCMQCGGAYICDLCDAERRRPDYQHLPFKKVGLGGLRFRFARGRLMPWLPRAYRRSAYPTPSDPPIRPNIAGCPKGRTMWFR